MSKPRFNIGSRVQLKCDDASDGKIVAKLGKGNWTVEWVGKTDTSQHHSRGLKAWTFAEPASSSSSSEDSESDGEGNDSDTEAPDSAKAYEDKKRKFDKIAKDLVDKTVVVRVFFVIFVVVRND